MKSVRELFRSESHIVEEFVTSARSLGINLSIKSRGGEAPDYLLDWEGKSIGLEIKEIPCFHVDTENAFLEEINGLLAAFPTNIPGDTFFQPSDTKVKVSRGKLHEAVHFAMGVLVRSKHVELIRVDLIVEGKLVGQIVNTRRSADDLPKIAEQSVFPHYTELKAEELRRLLQDDVNKWNRKYGRNTSGMPWWILYHDYYRAYFDALKKHFPQPQMNLGLKSSIFERVFLLGNYQPTVGGEGYFPLVEL